MQFDFKHMLAESAVLSTSLHISALPGVKFRFAALSTTLVFGVRMSAPHLKKFCWNMCVCLFRLYA